MQALSAGTDPAGRAFGRYTAEPLKILSRWLVGRVVSLSVATVLLHQAALTLGVDGFALPLAVLGAVLTYGTFTEILGTVARRRPERAGALALGLLRPLEWLMVPLADPLSILGRAVRRRVPKSRTVDARVVETEVEWVVSEGEKAGSIAPAPAEMIRKVLDFKDLTAREVMVPRRKILGIEIGTPLHEVMAMVAREKHSRYPVYRETLDNVAGQLYVKDLFALVKDGRLEKGTLAPGTKVSVLPEATRPAGVLRRMLGGSHVAVPAWARCTALLVRGYVRIGAAGDAAWGIAPEPPQ